MGRGGKQQRERDRKERESKTGHLTDVSSLQIVVGSSSVSCPERAPRLQAKFKCQSSSRGGARRQSRELH